MVSTRRPTARAVRRARCRSSVARRAYATASHHVRRGGRYPLTGLFATAQPVVALSPQKVHPWTAAGRGVGPRDPRPPRSQPVRRVESCGSTLRFHPFASKRFHVLLNSLFKVLFNFPSRYLFAIGLVLYLALDGVYHPLWAALTSNPTPRTLRADPTVASTGLTPAMGKAPIRRTWASVRTGRGCPKRHSSR